MVNVTIQRAQPDPPPVESVTITVDAETARALRAVAGFGAIHYNAQAQALLAQRGLERAEVVRLMQPIWHAIDAAGL